RVADDRTSVTLRKSDTGTLAGEASRPREALTAAGDPDDGIVGAVLDQAIARRASDALFSPGLRPRLRVDGNWVDAEAPVRAASDIEQAFLQRLSEARRHILADTGSVDLAFGRRDGAGTEVRFRVSLFRQHTGLAAALRPLWTALASLADLSLPAALVPMV